MAGKWTHDAKDCALRLAWTHSCKSEPHRLLALLGSSLALAVLKGALARFLLSVALLLSLVAKCPYSQGS